MTCAIHRYSMGLCRVCGEAPLGSMPATGLAAAAPEAAPPAMARCHRVDWTKEFVFCLDCSHYGAAVLDSRSARYHCVGCDSSSVRCANATGDA